MKRSLGSVALILLVLATNVSRQAQSQSQSPPTVASLMDHEINRIEERLVNVAEAMPEDKYSFSPEALNIPGSDYRGVFSFAAQIKHVAASNYFLFSSVTGEKVPAKLFNDGKGPDDLKTKAGILKFLKDSFALGHRAAATLTVENILQTPAGGKSPRLHMAQFGVAEAYNHYGQMVEYLRMNGIVPPATRKESN